MIIKSYNELRHLRTFEERFEYLRFKGRVGESTFGYDRYFNQWFYQTLEWKRVRDEIIFRDNGCDLGIPGYDIRGVVTIHHMNIITLDDIEKRSEILLDPNFLISTIHQTHNAIHYGDAKLLPRVLTERTKNDMCPWRT